MDLKHTDAPFSGGASRLRKTTLAEVFEKDPARIAKRECKITAAQGPTAWTIAPADHEEKSWRRGGRAARREKLTDLKMCWANPRPACAVVREI